MKEFRIRQPEECGISSLAIKKYIQMIEGFGLSTHALVIARGDSIVFERYFPPFDKDFLHRQYSITKSWVSIAVGFAVQDRLVSLDLPIGMYFPEECQNASDALIGKQTVRQMLMMSVPKKNINWFRERSSDRVSDYFAKTRVCPEDIGNFYYDSTGSFILSAMVERVTGMEILEYLRVKLLDKIGVSQDIRCLKCPGGHSWGDSGLLARPTDNLKLMHFIMNGGRIDGEQILSEDYLREAISCRIETHEDYEYESFGYGYQIWRTYSGGISFCGMGDQFTIAFPDKQIMLSINSDNQGNKCAGDIIVRGFYETIYLEANEEHSKNAEAYKDLSEYADTLKLYAAKGMYSSPRQKEIDGRRFVLHNNSMGIKYICISFSGDSGMLEYENSQGLKHLPFGLLHNKFCLFPEEGYSREVGSVYVPGSFYKCASSGAWISDSELMLEVQIIDDYFGRLKMYFRLLDVGIKIKLEKYAEDFLDSYKGEALALPQ